MWAAIATIELVLFAIILIAIHVKHQKEINILQMEKEELTDMVKKLQHGK